MKRILLSVIAVLLPFASLLAQSISVSGQVTDEQYEPLIGVSIVDQQSGTGLVTGTDGSFRLTTRQGAMLTFSYLGYETQNVKVSDGKMNVVLTPTSMAIDEVVVVGYGVQRKESVVGAISTTSSEDLKKAGATNLSTALAGNVSGMTFTVDSGRPGDDNATLYIRGVSTLSASNSTPLVLVDGVEREWSQIAPEDIERMSILKDASATAVYGVRGANGVILINTKRGEKGAPKVGLTYKFALQQPTRIPTFLGSYDHAILRNESLINDGGSALFSDEAIEHYRLGDSPYLYPDNNYVKDFLQQYTPMQTANVNIRGGSEKVNYYVALSGQDQDGIYKQFDNGKYPSNSNYKSINLRSNIDFQFSPTTTLSLDLNARLSQRQNNSQGLSDNSIFELLYQTPPMSYPYRNPDGSYGANTDSSQANVLAILSDWGYSRLADNILESTVKLNQKLDFLTKGLSARAQVSFNSYYEVGTKVNYNPATYNYKEDADGNPVYTLVTEEVVPAISSLSGRGLRRRLNMEYALNYNRTFGDHAVTAMATYTQSTYNVNANLPQSYLGYAARVTYAYRSTYLAEINTAYNGSDQFEKKHRYGFFPSFSVGYVASNLKFIKESMPWITFMKIRATYGEVGNDQIGSDRFLYLQTYEKNGSYYFGNDSAFGGQACLIEGDMGNENVTWEVAKKSNIGMDMELFGKLSANFDVFREDRENIFIARKTTPMILGVGTAKENLGKVRSEGFEVELNWNDRVSKDFSYFVKGMLSYSRNSIIYQDEVKPKYEYMRRTGKQVGQFFGYEVLGYYTPDDFDVDAEGRYTLKTGQPIPQYSVQPGDFKYRDLNGDNVIDTYDEGPIGNTSIPQIVYNLSYGIRYHQFDMNMIWQGAGGNSKLMTKSLYEPVREKNRFQEIHLYRWTEERWRNGEEILYPRLSSTTNKHNQCTNTYYLKDGDYLRLKSLEIGYTFNKRQLSALGLSSIRVYLGGTNLLTFSDIKNFDPEMGDSSGFFYPQMKIYSFGVNINF